MMGVERIWRSMPAEWAKEMVSRGIIGGKYLQTKFHFWVDDTEIDKWADTKRIFFILAIGRSGTNFLAHLLNQAPGVLVVHEPLLNESKPHQDAFLNQERAHAYIREFRKKEIFLRVKRANIDVYGEVNSYLRRHCEALREAFPNAKFFHLIRDGRDFVRSAISRNSMKWWAPDTYKIRPKPGDTFRASWRWLSRFEKLCWYWKVENEYLRDHINEFVRLEDILKDYKYLQTHLLDPLKLSIAREQWHELRHQRRNRSARYAIPHWTSWPAFLAETYERICGAEMRRYGYNWDTYQGKFDVH